jgi:hypothetical protein
MFLNTFVFEYFHNLVPQIKRRVLYPHKKWIDYCSYPDLCEFWNNYKLDDILNKKNGILTGNHFHTVFFS